MNLCPINPSRTEILQDPACESTRRRLFIFLSGTENDEGRLEDGNDKRNAGQNNRMFPREMKQQRSNHPKNDARDKKGEHSLQFFFLSGRKFHGVTD